jgi:serine/threonine protein kinase
MSLHLARLLRFKNLAFNIFVFVIISGVEAMAFGTDERSSTSTYNQNDDSPDYERQRSVLLVFDEVSCIRKAWWHLPPQWKWDVNGGPRGRIYSNPEDFPGEEYADFTPEKRVSVGRGIQGEVRRRLCNGRVLACKKTSIDPAHRIVSQESMKEVESLKKLSHQHISQLVGIFIHDNDLYSLSYPVAEMDLKGYLDLNRTLNPTWVNSLIEGMGCLSNALAYAHAAGVKHRDIHCGNIVIIGGTMILIDWGMSRLDHSPI